MKMGEEIIKSFQLSGYFISDIPALPDEELKGCLFDFVNQPMAQKEPFLQKHFDFGFDGYSYQGQTDSTNQGYEDLLDTFVFSDLNPVEKFPLSFQNYLKHFWPTVSAEVEKLEKMILSILGISMENMGHMVSCNYYPAQQNLNPILQKQRLTEHTDVSLLTVFPFGLPEGLGFQQSDGSWRSLQSQNTWVVFPGYLIEVLTEGKIKATNHKVALSGNSEKERFSFAFFSIPGPKWGSSDGKMNAHQYFQKYLSLFE